MLFRIARIGRDPVVNYASEELKRCLGVMDPSLEILLLTYEEIRLVTANRGVRAFLPVTRALAAAFMLAAVRICQIPVFQFKDLLSLYPAPLIGAGMIKLVTIR